MKSRSVILGALLAAVFATSPTPPAAAKPAAVEEYTLTLPGAERVGRQKLDPLISTPRDAGPIGVTGEREDEPPLLGSVASAIISPGGLVLAVAVVTAVAVSIRTGKRR
jgi:hypothetical protein